MQYISAIADALMSMEKHICENEWIVLQNMSGTVGREHADTAQVVGRLFWYYTIAVDSPSHSDHIYQTVLDKLRWEILEGRQEGYIRLLSLVLHLTHHSAVHKAVETALNNNSKFQTLSAKHYSFQTALGITLQEYLVNE